ncbi:MAG TPA: class I SAM-dependent methyltransferase, partial [Candidatus Binatia bacterium]|nr:class I SAM-dependent methyltransferase [Candidatus Binatia bacterium]
MVLIVCLAVLSARATAETVDFYPGKSTANGNPTPSAAGTPDESPYIAPFVPTPQEVVDRMLELAALKKDDVLYDLGSGDGRIVLTAARKYGIRAVGFEISPDLVKTSRQHIAEAGLEHLAEIRQEDIRNVDLSPATVVTLYLYPGANLRLRPAIVRQLRPGSRVVSLQFTMGSW